MEKRAGGLGRHGCAGHPPAAGTGSRGNTGPARLPLSCPAPLPGMELKLSPESTGSAGRGGAIGVEAVKVWATGKRAFEESWERGKGEERGSGDGGDRGER